MSLKIVLVKGVNVCMLMPILFALSAFGPRISADRVENATIVAPLQRTTLLGDVYQ